MVRQGRCRTSIRQTVWIVFRRYTITPPLQCNAALHKRAVTARLHAQRRHASDAETPKRKQQALDNEL